MNVDVDIQASKLEFPTSRFGSSKVEFWKLDFEFELDLGGKPLPPEY